MWRNGINWMQWLDPARWALPGCCAVCRLWGPQRVCAGCRARFMPVRLACSACGLGLAGAAHPPALSATTTATAWRCGACTTEPPPWAEVFAALDYGPPWAALLQRLKYGHEPALAVVLGDVLREALGGRVARGPRAASGHGALLPVPLHPNRLGARGFNQSLLLAKQVARGKPWRVLPAALQRVIDTPAQARQGRRARLDNLQAAFALAPGFDPQGGHWVLVDDVMTTGATLDALARLLLRHGAARVDAWVLARTPAPGVD